MIWPSLSRGGVLLGALLLAGSCTPAAGPGRPVPAPRLVYLTAPAPERQPYPLADWRGAGALVVHRFGDLRAAVGAETEALVLDAAVADAVDRAWLRAQAGPPRPRVVVGVNLTLRELQELVGAPAPQAHWQPDEPHFAIVAFGPDCAAAGQERFSRFGPLPVFISAWIDRYTECTEKG